METLVREKGVNSFQMFMTYKDLYMLRDCELYQVFRACRDVGAVARVHAENGELVAEVSPNSPSWSVPGPTWGATGVLRGQSCLPSPMLTQGSRAPPHPMGLHECRRG